MLIKNMQINSNSCIQKFKIFFTKTCISKARSKEKLVKEKRVSIGNIIKSAFLASCTIRARTCSTWRLSRAPFCQSRRRQDAKEQYQAPKINHRSATRGITRSQKESFSVHVCTSIVTCLCRHAN